MSLSDADLAALYEEHASGLFAFLMNLTRSEADTKNALQETFCRLVRQPELASGLRQPRAFLFKVAYRVIIDQQRREATRARYVEEADQAAILMTAADPDEATFRREVEAAMITLPTEQRAVLHLKLWEDLTFDEIARALDIPANTAASRYRYGLDKLREALRPLYEEIR